MSPRNADEGLAGSRRESGTNALQRALTGERATNLGRLGRALEAALFELRSAPAAEREARAYACAEAVWFYLVQREACGLVQHDQVIEMYGIPATVLAKVGAARPSSSGA